METKNVLFLLGYSLFVAGGHILQKTVLNAGVDTFVFAFIRILTGFLIISTLIITKKRPVISILRHHYKAFLILGIGFSGFGILLKLWGLSHTSATNASFIMSFSSIAVIFFAYLFLGESMEKRFYPVVAAMIFGIYLVTTAGRGLVPQKGDIIIFGLAIFIGMMRVYGKHVLTSLSVLETAWGRSLFGTLFLGLLIPLTSENGFSTIASVDVLILVMANGITFSGSILFFYKALQSEGAANTGMFALLVPVFTLILGSLFLGESFTLIQILGGSIIIIGSAVITKIKMKQANF